MPISMTQHAPDACQGLRGDHCQRRTAIARVRRVHLARRGDHGRRRDGNRGVGNPRAVRALVQRSRQATPARRRTRADCHRTAPRTRSVAVSARLQDRADPNPPSAGFILNRREGRLPRVPVSLTCEHEHLVPSAKRPASRGDCRTNAKFCVQGTARGRAEPAPSGFRCRLDEKPTIYRGFSSNLDPEDFRVVIRPQTARRPPALRDNHRGKRARRWRN